MLKSTKTAGKTAENVLAMLAEQRKQIAEMSKRQDEKLQEFIDKFTAATTPRRSEPKEKFWETEIKNLGENVKGKAEDIVTLGFQKEQHKGHLAEYSLVFAFDNDLTNLRAVNLTRKEVKALHAALTEMLDV